MHLSLGTDKTASSVPENRQIYAGLKGIGTVGTDNFFNM